MRIAIGCDDTGFPLKEHVTSALEAAGHDLLDLGTFSKDPVDYPDYARAVGQAVLRGFVDAGILMCGSGTSASIAANKLRGIRAALCHDVQAARLSREEDDANVLCLGAREVEPARAVEITIAWVAAAFKDDERFVRKVSKVALLEASSGVADKPPARPATPPRQDATAAAGEDLAEPPDAIAEAYEESAVEPSLAVEEAASGTEMEAPQAPSSPAQPVDEIFKLPAVQETMDLLESQDFLDRLWVKDATLWKGETTAIRNRLGWLTSPTIMRGHAEDIKTFADEIRRLQFTHVVLVGMGGSSLGAEVFNLTFGSKMGFPDLLLLDSTDPEAVKRTLDRLNLSRTLFIVASKSGATAETMAFYQFFRGQVESSSVPRAGIHFVAITDPGRPLDKLATESGFRRTFLNPASIGGRYSALSFFGLVPAALIGIDITMLIDRAHNMVETCGNALGPRDSAAVRLGAALAGLAKSGRDKVTLVLSRELRSLGPWIEQLLAESLGKDGKGLVPVDDEPLGSPAVYGADRVFVAITLEGDETYDVYLDALEDAGHPVIRIPIKDTLEIGAEFFRWELATAAAGVALGVNPFDEPDVTRAKENTAALLASWKKSKKLPEWPADAEENGLLLMANLGKKVAGFAPGLSAHFAQAQPGDYLAIQAYLAPTADTWSRLQELRTLLRDRLKIATTVSFGPRYLHSTGQLHKGGRANGLFVQITGEDREDMAIPGMGYGFSTFKAAQALGDLQALREAGRRVVRVHLTGKQTQGVEQLVQVVQKILKKK
ncbi:MAG TPA: RpiB/LacA/LacB family sugar-phosphate isomerase [Methylomirabilota bacterium]|nr:RpiB/LacA/LacB family sugar-phosphate isomerase [Methylomirabilota bacterium]